MIERNLRTKVVEPDFRYPMMDGRLALGRLCAVQGRHEEAAEWFAKARTALDEQGARPLRAIVDYDEALMYVRRGAAGDRERAAPLLEAALAQFRGLEMTGWIRRAESLLREGKEWVPPVQPGREPQTGQPPPRPFLGARKEKGNPRPGTKDRGPTPSAAKVISGPSPTPGRSYG